MSARSYGQLFRISLVLLFMLAAGGLVSLKASSPPLQDPLELNSFSPLPSCREKTESRLPQITCSQKNKKAMIIPVC